MNEKKIAMAGIAVGVVIAVVGWLIGAQPDPQLARQINELSETNAKLSELIRKQDNMAIITLNENYKRLLDQFKQANEESDPHKRLSLLTDFFDRTESDRQYGHELTEKLFALLHEEIARAEVQVGEIDNAKNEEERERKESQARQAEAARLAESEERVREALSGADNEFRSEIRCMNAACTRWIIP